MEQKRYENLGETLYKGTLDNGLTVYVIPKPGYAKKVAGFTTGYGGADRRFRLDGAWRDTPAGIAHFLEHELFDTETGNALADLASNGASPNAFTSFELTAYHFECTEGFEENLKTLLSFVSIPYFTAESVTKEQGIIGQEIGMVEDTPQYAVYFNLLKGLYSVHPIRDSIAGTVESIGEITAETLYDLHRAFYRPSNMVLCVVGDVDPQTVLRTAREVLETEYHEPPKKDYGPIDEKPVVSARTEVHMAVAKPLFLAGARVQTELSGEVGLKQELIGQLAMQYLAGKSSPFYVRLYGEGLITSDFSAGFSKGRSYAIAEFGGESGDPDRVLEEIKGEIAGILQNGMDEARFARLKKATSGEILRGLDSMEVLCHGQTECHFHGVSIFDQMRLQETISAADVSEFIEKHLKPEHFALSIVSPK